MKVIRIRPGKYGVYEDDELLGTVEKMGSNRWDAYHEITGSIASKQTMKEATAACLSYMRIRKCHTPVAEDILWLQEFRKAAAARRSKGKSKY